MHQQGWVIPNRVLLMLLLVLLATAAGWKVFRLFKGEWLDDPASQSEERKLSTGRRPPADVVTEAIESARCALRNYTTTCTCVQFTSLEPAVYGPAADAVLAAQKCVAKTCEASAYADAMRVHSPEAATFAAKVAIAAADVVNATNDATRSLVAARNGMKVATATQAVMIATRAAKHTTEIVQKVIGDGLRILSDVHVNQRYTYQRATSVVHMPTEEPSGRIDEKTVDRIIAEAANAVEVATQNVLRAIVACNLAAMDKQNEFARKALDAGRVTAGSARLSATHAGQLKSHNAPAAVFTARLAVAAADISTAAVDAAAAAITDTSATANQVAERVGNAAHYAFEVMRDVCKATPSLVKEGSSQSSKKSRK